MKKNNWILIFIVLLSLQLTACGSSSSGAPEKIEPAIVEPIDGTELNRVILTERAVERLAIETVAIQEELIDGTQQMVVPYSAVIYDLTGATWVYVNTEPLTFVREPIVIISINDDTAILSDGPELGTEVATVGVAELYGTDTGVGK